uniref:hypothetical protein n=2 Tax=Megasphaera TaxID=906 RepID=UPI002596EA02
AGKNNMAIEQSKGDKEVRGMEDKEKEPCGNRALKIIRMIFTDCAKVSMTDMQQATLYRLYFVIGWSVFIGIVQVSILIGIWVSRY